MAEREAERKAHFRTEMANRVMEVAPYAIAQLSGASMAGQLIDSFSEDELKQFTTMMKPEQREIVYRMLTQAKRGRLAERIIGGIQGASAHSDGTDEVTLPVEPAAVFVELFGSLSEQQSEGLSVLAGPERGEVLRTLVSEAQRIISAAGRKEGESLATLAQRAAPLLESAVLTGFLALFRTLSQEKVRALLEMATPRQGALLQHLVVLLVERESATASQQQQGAAAQGGAS